MEIERCETKVEADLYVLVRNLMINCAYRLTLATIVLFVSIGTTRNFPKLELVEIELFLRHFSCL